MKTIKTLSAKKIISFCIAMALIFGSLFTANVGISTNAATVDTNYSQWDGTFDTELEGFGTEEAPYLITSAAELAAVCYGKAIGSKTGAHFAVSGISEFYMDSVTAPATVKGFNSATEVGSYYSSIATAPAVWFPNTDVTLYFDGNNATIYGLYMNAAKGGLFSQVMQGSTIKNIAIKNSYANTTSYTGGLFAQAHWGTITSAIYVTNCIVRNNYFNSTSDVVGTISGHGAAAPHRIENCLAADNIIKKNGTDVQYTYFVFYNDSVPAGHEYYFKNCIGIGSAPQFKYKSSNQAPIYENNYYSNAAVITAVDGVTKLADGGCKSVIGKVNMTSLNWATNTTDGDWYAMKGDYPLPYKPDGWVDLEIPEVWDGTAASEFAGGKGTKDDPYIIETASQLRKMVLEGGRIDTGKTKQVDNNGTKVTVKVYEKAYYKVADGVTDIYLSPVVDGTLDTLKNLVNASSNKVINWTEGLFTDASFSADTDGDGIRDQATAFRGEFDGNGVTIHGLYSKTVDRSWNNEGVGFVPALMDDAVIKNVTFDKAFIHNTGSTFAGVITASLGYDDTKATNTDLDPSTSGGQKVNGSAVAVTSVGIHNVTVKNSRVQTNSTSGYGGVAGFVASHGTPVACSFTNCLFDSSNELVVPDGFAPIVGTGKGGFINLGQSGTQHFYFENCVSLGVYPDNKANDHPQYVNCYTSEASTKSGLVGDITEYSVDTMPDLNWTQWSVVDGKPVITGISAAYDYATNWKEAIAYTNESRWDLNYAASSVGNWTMIGAHEDGVYINYENMQGSGTKDDPYLISDALTLARVIGSGGTNYTEKLYFKLTNDINVGGLRWIDQKDYAIDADGDGVLDDPKYSYRPFEGVLDGDGYAVTGLYANSENSAGLIPVLNGGTVKNLHIRDAVVVSGEYAGVIVGKMNSGNIINCAVEDFKVSSKFATKNIVGFDTDDCDGEGLFYTWDPAGDGVTKGEISNVYAINGDEYFYRVVIDEETGEVCHYGTGTIVDEYDEDISTWDIDTSVWYIGGKEGSLPRLVNRAKAMPCADIDGDGEGYEYSSADLIALKNKLLKKSGFENVYGDVSKNGKVNSSDLVILTRATIGDYNHIKDGFWRNVALGNMEIYYGENDNYDAARKLELYLESALDVDIVKNASGSNTYVHTNDGTATPGSQLAIVVGNVGTYTTSLTGNDYAVTYDAENAILWIQGANFTGVEQAVLDFIANSDAATNKVYTIESATLSVEKQPKTIGGTTYYYAWGDEFDVATSDGSITKDVWEYGEMGTEENQGAASKYMNLETANPADLASLYEVKDGKLSIWRGIDKDAYNATTHAWGYKPVTLDGTTAWGAEIDADDIIASAGVIDTQNSLLFKQGYIEMKASLPNDGHSFPAFWLLGAPDGGQNRTYESSLFGKIYKENPNWTGINAMNGAYPNSYKYQLPTAYLEMDIIELMQDISYVKEFNSSWENFWGSGKQPETWLTGVDRTKVNLTVHKWYGENVENDTLYVIDWDKWLSNRTAPTQHKLTTNGGDFETSVADTFITRWDGMLNHDMGSLANLATEHTYGFKWVANETQNTFTVTLYIDGEERLTFNQSQEYYLDSEAAGGTYVEDGKTFNQYVYIMFDNHFYTANQEYKNGTTLYTDLLTYEDGDKTTFDIDYVRVYQEDGKRDIVTKETENFNNNNHFGYGK